MRFVIVTGMSGAGKSTAMKILEDMEYFCVDNLPIALLQKFVELSFNSMGDIDKVALGLDIRSGDLSTVDSIIDKLKQDGKKCEILFLEANNETLIKRYKATRRSHPLGQRGRVDEGLVVERQLLAFLKKKADYIIDTDNMLTKELRAELEKIFIENKEYKNLFINVVSFGFKNGIPADSDLIFDVRFMPNPFYVDELKTKTGNDKEVNDFVMQSGASVIFLKKLEDMLDFLIPNYVEEGKNQLVIGIGCTGGKHRSVTIANKVYEFLKEKGEYGIKLTHRDIERE